MMRNTVEHLLDVYEADVEGGVPLMRLLHDDAKAGDLVGTGYVPAEARLLISELGSTSSFNLFRRILLRTLPGTERIKMVPP
jgi:hypothetical protein